MNLKEIKEQVIQHLASISDEEFENELINAGIENSPALKQYEEGDIFINYQVGDPKTTWGYVYYKETKENITQLMYKGVA